MTFLLRTRRDAVERMTERVLAYESRGSVVLCREEWEEDPGRRKEGEARGERGIGGSGAPEGALMVTDGRTIA